MSVAKLSMAAEIEFKNGLISSDVQLLLAGAFPATANTVSIIIFACTAYRANDSSWSILSLMMLATFIGSN